MSSNFDECEGIDNKGALGISNKPSSGNHQREENQLLEEQVFQSSCHKGNKDLMLWNVILIENRAAMCQIHKATLLIYCENYILTDDSHN